MIVFGRHEQVHGRHLLITLAMLTQHGYILPIIKVPL